MTPNSSQSQELVKLIDSLMEELDRLASLSSTPAEQVFQRAIETLELIFQPEATAIFMLGPEDAPFNVASNGYRPDDFFTQVAPAIDGLKSSPEWSYEQKIGKHHVQALGFGPQERMTGILALKSQDAATMKLQRSVLDAVTELLGRFSSLKAEAVSNEDFFATAQQFSLNCLSTLDQQGLAKVIVNDARMIFACERVQLFEPSLGSLRLSAVSSVSMFEKRTELLRRSVGLARTCLTKSEPIVSWQKYPERKLQTDLEDYRELSGLPFFAFLPMQIRKKDRSKPIALAVALIEFGSQPDPVHLATAANVVIPQAARAIYNTQQIASIPLAKFFLFFNQYIGLRPLVRFCLPLFMVALAVAACFLVQTDFKVRIQGELRAEQERQVYSPHNSVVEEIRVGYGDRVEKGQLLARLRSPDLELELEETIGEIRKLENLRAAKEVALNQAATGNTDSIADQAKLAGEVAEVDFQILVLKDKEDHIRQQIEELQLFAPIAGKIITWDLRKKLAKKPTVWGEPLLRIADEDSRWQLQFKIPEKKVGYVLAAQVDDPQNGPEEPLSVEYFFQSSPEQKFHSSLTKIAGTTEIDAEFGPCVAGRSPIDATQELRRHGAKVTGDVYCGKRSLAYVWTYELVDAIRRRFVW